MTVISRTVDADPYAWPYDGVIDPEHTAMMMIDWQPDVCGSSDASRESGPAADLAWFGLVAAARVLDAARAVGMVVVHTREGHEPGLSDLAPNKGWRSKQAGAGIGGVGAWGRRLVRGEPGWEIADEVAPISGERIIDKPGKGSFHATDLELVLRNRGVTQLIFTGVTTDVGVQTTMREANDRGFECLLLSDCTGAVDRNNHEGAIEMVKMQGGVFGAVAESDALIDCLGVE